MIRFERTAFFTAGVALLLPLGACGFGTAHAQPTPGTAELWHLAAQCIRDHGQPDFPDPTIDSHGQPQLPDGVAKPSQAEMDACRPQVDAASRTGGSRPQATTNPAQMRQFAQCMRDNGLEDWPDPDVNGTFHLPPDLFGKSIPRWPAIQAAWNGPCAKYNPAGHISA